MANMHKKPGNLINEIENNPSDLWTFLTKSGIIDIDNVQEKIMASKREKVRKLHN